MVFEKLKELKEKLMGTRRISYEDDFEEGGEYVEVKKNIREDRPRLLIKYFIIKDYSDVKTILNFIREGDTIIFANIKPLKSKDITELKRAISKIKKTCDAVDGDVIGLEENFILVYPNYVSVSKDDFE